MAEEVCLVTLNRSEDNGFGFSLLAKPGLPPIIYNILDESPAAVSGEVEVGDVILKINETDVIKFTTKEVLKCLRLSEDPVTLKIKRDPKIKATVRKHLLSGGDNSPEIEKCATSFKCQLLANEQNSDHNHQRSNGTYCQTESSSVSRDLHQQEKQRLLWQPLAGNNDVITTANNETRHHQTRKFEAYMMTGEHILNISKMTHIGNTVNAVDDVKRSSLRCHQHANNNSTFQQQNIRTHHQTQSWNNYSLPSSPNEAEMGLHHHRTSSNVVSSSGPNSAETSPIISANNRKLKDQQSPQDPYNTPTMANYVRTSRSEDQLQANQNATCSVSVANAEQDEDNVASSLNTLLMGDGRHDMVASLTDSDRIVWTYNAPIGELQKLGHSLSNGSSSSHSNTSPSSSPLHSSGSPNSPTSVSSSVMSSQSGSRRLASTPTTAAPNGPTHSSYQHYHGHNNLKRQQDYSVSEAISNISSPDYHEDDDSALCMPDCLTMDGANSDGANSDSDSTLLVSEPRTSRKKNSSNNNSSSSNNKQLNNFYTAFSHGDNNSSDNNSNCNSGGHRIVIQVRGSGETGRLLGDYGTGNDCFDEDNFGGDKKSSSPLSSEDESDVESLHSFHYSPKAVDMPSAIRLAKRLYSLDGFKKSDVSRHLSKNNDFSRAVAEEYLKYFNFEKDTLDLALRKFLKQFSLTGETQERERVLVHFSKRYLDCNPGTFNSQDAVHTLTCAIMLLNTDLHGQNIARKMTCNEFIENLAGLNECENFPRDVLKQLYHAIKNYPLEWALDDDCDEAATQQQLVRNPDSMNLSAGNPFLDLPISSNPVEYKKGYVMRKCCYETNAKRTPFHKRSWKMFYCTLRDMVLFLHKDEAGFKKCQMGDNLAAQNAIRIHHSLATKAEDYTKKQFVFRLQTADQAEYLFQTSDSKELQSWIDVINFVAASFSASPLEAAVGSQKKFQRPLLPCSHTKFTLREQLADHEDRVMKVEQMLDEHKRNPPEKGAKSLVVQNYRERDTYLNFELKRYRVYVQVLHQKITDSNKYQLLLSPPCHGSDTMQIINNLILPVTENSIGEIMAETNTNTVICSNENEDQERYTPTSNRKMKQK